MSEENKNTANEQEETEKDIPETETVNEPTEESPEATAGQDAEAEKASEADDDKETKSKTSFFGKKKKENKYSRFPLMNCIRLQTILSKLWMMKR